MERIVGLIQIVGWYGIGVTNKIIRQCVRYIATIYNGFEHCECECYEASPAAINRPSSERLIGLENI